MCGGRSFQLGEAIRHVTEAFAKAKKRKQKPLVLTVVSSATMSCARTPERDDNGAGIISVLPHWLVPGASIC